MLLCFIVSFTCQGTADGYELVAKSGSSIWSECILYTVPEMNTSETNNNTHPHHRVSWYCEILLLGRSCCVCVWRAPASLWRISPSVALEQVDMLFPACRFRVTKGQGHSWRWTLSDKYSEWVMLYLSLVWPNSDPVNLSWVKYLDVEKR